MAQKRYRVELAPAADRQRRKLPVDVQKRIVRALEQLETDPRPPGVRKLQGEDNLWFFNDTATTEIYTIEDDRLLVLVVRVANRRDAYGK